MADPSGVRTPLRSGSLRRQLISDAQWHVEAVADNLGRPGMGKHVPSVEDMRWHIGAARKDLELVAEKEGPAKPWFKDHALVISFFALLVGAITYVTTST